MATLACGQPSSQPARTRQSRSSEDFASAVKRIRESWVQEFNAGHADKVAALYAATLMARTDKIVGRIFYRRYEKRMSVSVHRRKRRAPGPVRFSLSGAESIGAFWFAPPRFSQAWEPTLLWNQFRSSTLKKANTQVESRTGAVALVFRWLMTRLSPVWPQSGLAWICFLLPSRPGEFRPEAESARGISPRAAHRFRT